MSKWKTNRPWWWIVNPWLYILRRDRAYEDALDIITELSLAENKPKRATLTIGETRLIQRVTKIAEQENKK